MADNGSVKEADQKADQKAEPGGSVSPLSDSAAAESSQAGGQAGATEEIDLFSSSGGDAAAQSYDEANIEMSPEQIDQVLETEAPEFMKSMAEVAKDKSITLREPNLSEADIEYLNEKDLWQQSTGFGKLIFRIFPGVVNLSLRLKKIRFRIFASIQSTRIRITNFSTDFFGNLKAFLSGGFKEVFRKLGHFFTELGASWKAKTKRQKLIIGSISLVSLVAVGIILLSWTKGIIPAEADLFVTSLDQFATKSYDYNPGTDEEPFYENLRTGLHVFHIEKLVVNIKRSKSSGENPMAAFDFYIEGSTPEALVEIKKKEIPIRDQMQRTIESYSFDQLESVEGKKDLIRDLEQELNAILVSGRIRAVRFKTAIVKP